MTSTTRSPFTFGIYAASQVGTWSGSPDDRHAIDQLVSELQGTTPFIVREYLHFRGASRPDDGVLPPLTMPDTWYVENERQLDLVLSYLPPEEDIVGWLAFIERAIERYGAITRYLQVTLEPNFPIQNIDGSSPGVLDALRLGVPTARNLLDARSLRNVDVGFSVAEPAEWLGGDDAFWATIADFPRESFANILDYVGLGLYPDAFSPVAPDGQPGDVRSLTSHALEHLRTVSLARAGIPASVPIRIVESGSPSSGNRTEDHQARSIEAIVDTVLSRRDDFNVRSFVLLGLRDADSSVDNPFARFGITDDRYRPKPAFHWYRDRIARTSARAR
ncbi:MAG: hypothetical protein ACTHQE_10630 [Thermomicrobiales bacterium]